MKIYDIDKKKLTSIKEKPFKLEKDLQTLVENNLKNLLNLIFVKSEFIIKDYRIDTLAFDEQSKSFVIIEYKRQKNNGVIDQGFSYLNLMLNNKAEFILECNENLSKKLQRKDIDWSQSRIIFVSNSFTQYQKDSTNFKDIGIELLEIKKYENNTLSVNLIKKSKGAESIKKIKSSNNYDIITKEIKEYTEEQHVSKASDIIKEVYENLKNAILDIDSDVEVIPLKYYIGFKKDSNICDIEIRKNSIDLYINAKWNKLNDPQNLFTNVSNIGHHGNGDYKIKIENCDNIEYIISVLRQLIIS